MKNKAPKIIFILSFIPYLLVLLAGIASAIWGAGFFYTSYYGWDGFVFGITIMLYQLLCMIPVIPVCFIYQLAYILRRKVKALGKIGIKKYAGVFIVAGVVIAGAILLDTFEYDIGKFFEKQQAKSMLKRAEEKITYDESSYHSGSGIFNIKDIIDDTLLIDYDNFEVGLVYYVGYPEYWSATLSGTSPDSDIIRHMDKDYLVQAEIPLSSPGKRLISFYPNDEYSNHLTIAFILETEDGSVYCADELKEKDTGYIPYSGLGSSPYRVDKNTKLSDLEPLGQPE